MFLDMRNLEIILACRPLTSAFEELISHRWNWQVFESHYLKNMRRF